MRLFILLLNIFLSQLLTAQQDIPNQFFAIDAKAMQLPDSLSKTITGIAGYINSNFTTQNEKARAIFVWVASNIAYDTENINTINLYEPAEEKSNKTLATRSGSCHNYAVLFQDICEKSGITCLVVEGSTRQDGFINYIAHAWCAVLIDSNWFMFDPTWGAGYISKAKFYKKFNDHYYKVSPSLFIKTHMPFDYLWQFLYYPVNTASFYEWAGISSNTMPFFDYRDSIALYEKMDRIAQLTGGYSRIEKTGVKNTLVFSRLQNYKNEIVKIRLAQTANMYNEAVTVYNEAISKFNTFTHYQNKMYMPVKPDNEIKMMIDTAYDFLMTARFKLTQLDATNKRIDTLALQLNQSIENVLGIVKEEYTWLSLYFSKSKTKRRAMFYEKNFKRMNIPAK